MDLCSYVHKNTLLAVKGECTCLTPPKSATETNDMPKATPNYVASIPPPPITVVSHKYAPPPFATLASVQNAGGGGGGGAFARDATISLAITPSLPVKHDLIVGGGGAKCEAERFSRR